MGVQGVTVGLWTGTVSIHIENGGHNSNGRHSVSMHWLPTNVQSQDDLMRKKEWVIFTTHTAFLLMYSPPIWKVFSSVQWWWVGRQGSRWWKLWLRLQNFVLRHFVQYVFWVLFSLPSWWWLQNLVWWSFSVSQWERSLGVLFSVSRWHNIDFRLSIDSAVELNQVGSLRTLWLYWITSTNTCWTCTMAQTLC